MANRQIGKFATFTFTSKKMTRISQITSAAKFLLVRKIERGKSRALPVPLSHYKNSGGGNLYSSHSSTLLSLTFLRQGPRLTSLSKWVGNLARHSSRRSFHSCLAAQTNATDFELILASRGDHVFKQKEEIFTGHWQFPKHKRAHIIQNIFLIMTSNNP